MEKRKKRTHDFSVTAFRVVQKATGQIEPKPARTFDAKALGHLGGLKVVMLGLRLSQAQGELR